MENLAAKLPPFPEPEVPNTSILTEYKKTNKDLTINEILYLLRTRVEPGREIPPNFSYPPWRIPSSSHPKASLINSILSKSMEVQSSTVPKSGDFEDFILSNASMSVAGLMRSYLRSLLGSEVATVVLGVLLWDPAARNGADDYEGTPYLWLEVAGFPVDNAYVDIPKTDANIEYFYRAKQVNCYVKENPFKTQRRLYYGQEDTLNHTVKHNFKIYRDYSTEDNVEKFVVFGFESADLNPCVKMYDILMREYLKGEHGVEPEDLERKWAIKCWGCGKVAQDAKEQEGLKTCTICKRARYCGKECQAKEWKSHKLLHREMEMTREILSREEQGE